MSDLVASTSHKHQKVMKCQTLDTYNKMLSYCGETALQGALLLAKMEDWNWETIFYGHYRSILNHSDIIGSKICRIW